MIRKLIAVATLSLLALPATAQDATRAFHHIAGDVYLFQNNFHNSLIVKTEAGTVRVDPINAEASEWLNANLSEIGAGPVTHLIYSHSHGDHASGGSAHAGAEIIAHEAAPEMIDGVMPTMRVGDTATLEVGGKQFELINLGAGHDNHMLAVVVRPESVAFIVDVATPNRLPYKNFPGADIDGIMAQIETAMALDFDIFAPGHSKAGVHADLQANLDYIQTLKAGVLAGLQAGQSVDTIKQSLTLDDYAGWGQYGAWRELNIEGMATYLQNSGQVN